MSHFKASSPPPALKISSDEPQLKTNKQTNKKPENVKTRSNATVPFDFLKGVFLWKIGRWMSDPFQEL